MEKIGLYTVIIQILILASCTEFEAIESSGFFKDEYVPKKQIQLNQAFINVWTKDDTLSIGDTLNVKFEMPQVITEPYINRRIKLSKVNTFVKLDLINGIPQDSIFEFGTPLSLYKELYKYWKTIPISGKALDVYLFDLDRKFNKMTLEIKYVALKPGYYILKAEVNDLDAEYFQLDTVVNYKPQFYLPTELKPHNGFKYDLSTLKEQNEYDKKKYFLIYVKN
ncbi:MAG TPA: hypothetical protein PK622_09675 [Saprospiraceae bacterium]|jgi:hypothetical protein|nr:hypothetical protein [Saprospiraceae bacterium]